MIKNIVWKVNVVISIRFQEFCASNQVNVKKNTFRYKKFHNF